MKTILKMVPKVELHIHLDGSVRVKTVAELLHKNENEVKMQMVCDKMTLSLTDYLTKFELPLEVMQTKENLQRITRELLEDLQEEHVIYAEIRFAPFLHTKGGLTQEEVVKSIVEVTRSMNGILCNFILCCMRQDIINQNENNFKTLEVAYEYLNHGIVAIDLAGDESLYPTNQFESLFLKAKQLGIPYTIHAGEASDYHSIESALDMGASRIGHGIAAIQNKELLTKLREENILLEVCPQSNIDTKIVENKKDHPIKQLYQNCLLSINTDNRTVSNVTLTKEYEDLIHLLNFSLEDIKICNLNAIEHSFLKEIQKEKLRKQIEEGYYDTTYRS